MGRAGFRDLRPLRLVWRTDSVPPTEVSVKARLVAVLLVVAS